MGKILLPALQPAQKPPGRESRRGATTESKAVDVSVPSKGLGLDLV